MRRTWGKNTAGRCHSWRGGHGVLECGFLLDSLVHAYIVDLCTVISAVKRWLRSCETWRYTKLLLFSFPPPHISSSPLVSLQIPCSLWCTISTATHFCIH